MQLFPQRITRRGLFFASFLIGASALGCGGGGSNEEAVPLATTTRLLQPGDTWVYKVTFADGQASATETERVENRSANGSLTYRITSNQGSAEQVFERKILQSDAASPLYLEQETRPAASGTRTLTYPARYGVLFGTWQKDAILSNDAFTASYVTVNADGTVPPAGNLVDQLQSQSIASVGPQQYRIVGAETVTTPAGRFATWKVTQVGRANVDRGTYQHTVWYAPQIGNFVKWEAKSLDKNSKVYEMTLSTTTVRTP